MSNQQADDVACSVVRLFAAVAREAPGETALATPAMLDGALTNGSTGARVKLRTGVPQVVSLYAAEA
jgi:hypothetical protein